MSIKCSFNPNTSASITNQNKSDFSTSAYSQETRTEVKGRRVSLIDQNHKNIEKVKNLVQNRNKPDHQHLANIVEKKLAEVMELVEEHTELQKDLGKLTKGIALSVESALTPELKNLNGTSPDEFLHNAEQQLKSKLQSRQHKILNKIFYSIREKVVKRPGAIVGVAIDKIPYAGPILNKIGKAAGSEIKQANHQRKLEKYRNTPKDTLEDYRHEAKHETKSLAVIEDKMKRGHVKFKLAIQQYTKCAQQYRDDSNETNRNKYVAAYVLMQHYFEKLNNLNQELAQVQLSNQRYLIEAAKFIGEEREVVGLLGGVDKE